MPVLATHVVQGGLGGTIDRLGDLHEMFRPYAAGSRVQTAAQVTPLLLKVYFKSFLASANYEQAQQMILVTKDDLLGLTSLQGFI